MLTNPREYREIAEKSGLLGAVEARFVSCASKIEAVALKNLASRLRGQECAGMSRLEIADWIESLTYAKPVEDHRQLDVFAEV
jgi:hypothetical protein